METLFWETLFWEDSVLRRLCFGETLYWEDFSYCDTSLPSSRILGKDFLHRQEGVTIDTSPYLLKSNTTLKLAHDCLARASSTQAIRTYVFHQRRPGYHVTVWEDSVGSSKEAASCLFCSPAALKVSLN